MIGGAITVALGLASRRWPIGVHLWDKSLGDALYTVMIYLVLAWVRPDFKPRVLGSGALVISVAMELFQLTGIPARLPHIFQLVLGTTFAWHDIACYVAGAVVATALHVLAVARASAGKTR
jgi:hypothetical protein